jgi:hypothetical protein
MNRGFNHRFPRRISDSGPGGRPPGQGIGATGAVISDMPMRQLSKKWSI